MTDAAALREVLELLGRGWTRETDARDACGHRVQYNAESACCWCVTAAIRRAVGETPYTPPKAQARRLARRILTAIGSRARASSPYGTMASLAGWNDARGRSRMEVVAAVHRAYLDAGGTEG